MYNDVSVNENMHLATAFKILRRPGNDLWEHLSPDQFRFFRRTVIQIVLATDMAGHSELLQVNSLTFCDFPLSLLLKFAFRHPAAGLLPNPIITAVATYCCFCLSSCCCSAMLAGSRKAPTSLQWSLTATYSQSMWSRHCTATCTHSNRSIVVALCQICVAAQ